MNTPAAPSRIDAPSALPLGTRLAEFELREVLGVGGFGIVYLAFDHALEREVAVKEYMPASLAGRTETMHVSVRSQSDAESFALGLKSFVNEARLLARFNHPSLLKVLRFWEGNGTAYMAMPVMRGRTLKDVRLALDEPPSEAWLRALLDPLLGAIEKLHSEGVYHRDIAPDNIQIEPDGHPVLLDFGAARRVLSDKSQTLTAILKPAYAPIEQYAEVGAVKQGPWTDLYALGATLHYVLLKRPPAPATARTVHDEASILTTDRLPGCSENFLRTLDWMMAPRPMDRPQSVAALREVLDGRRAPPWPPMAAAMPPVSLSEDQTVVLQRSGQHAPAATRVDDPDATRVVPHTGSGHSAAPGLSARPQGLMSAPLPFAVSPTLPPTVSLHAPAPAPNAAAPSRSEKPPPSNPDTAPAATPVPGSNRMPLWLGAAAAVVLLGAAVVFWPRAAGPVAALPAAAVPSPAPAPVVVAPAPAPAALPAETPVATVAAQPEVAAPRVETPAPAAATTATTATTATAAAITATRPPPATTPPGRPGVVGDATPSNTASNKPPARTGSGQSPGTTSSPYGQGTGSTGGALSGSGGYAPPAQSAPPAYNTAPTPPPAGSPTTTPPNVPNAGYPAQPPAQAAPYTPEGKCGTRNPLRYFVCMERECLRSEFSSHPECQQWRKNAKPE